MVGDLKTNVDYNETDVHGLFFSSRNSTGPEGRGQCENQWRKGAMKESMGRKQNRLVPFTWHSRLLQGDDRE